MSAQERAAERRAQFVEAGLELLGTGAPLSVTGVIATAGLSPRYFYDSFADLDELQHAVFDHLVTEAEARGLATLHDAGSDPSAATRAVLEEMVAFLLDDPRRGRVLLTASLGSPVLAPRRVDELRRFAELLALHGNPLHGKVDADSWAAQVATRFAMGGFAEIVSAALDDPAGQDRAQLVDDLATLFDGVARSFAQMTRS